MGNPFDGSGGNHISFFITFSLPGISSLLNYCLFMKPCISYNHCQISVCRLDDMMFSPPEHRSLNFSHSFELKPVTEQQKTNLLDHE